MITTYEVVGSFHCASCENRMAHAVVVRHDRKIVTVLCMSCAWEVNGSLTKTLERGEKK